MARELTGRIFNIQRYCAGDGPGIRTTVFFRDAPCIVSGAIIRNRIRFLRGCPFRKMPVSDADAVRTFFPERTAAADRMNHVPAAGSA